MFFKKLQPSAEMSMSSYYLLGMRSSEQLPQLLSSSAHVFVNASLSFALICKHLVLISENENSDFSMIPVTPPLGETGQNTLALCHLDGGA